MDRGVKCSFTWLEAIILHFISQGSAERSDRLAQKQVAQTPDMLYMTGSAHEEPLLQISLSSLLKAHDQLTISCFTDHSIIPLLYISLEKKSSNIDYC